MNRGDENVCPRADLRVSIPTLLAMVLAAGNVVAAENIAPFPPGKNAALVKQVCTSCHSAMLVVERRYDLEGAKKRYRLYVGNPDSEQGRLVVDYLSTVLGEDASPR